MREREWKVIPIPASPEMVFWCVMAAGAVSGLLVWFAFVWGLL